MGVSRALAPLLSLGLHAGVVVGLGLVPRTGGPGTAARRPVVEVSFSVAPPSLTPGIPVVPLVAAGDVPGAEGVAAVSAALAVPGRQAASRGGGAEADLAAWTGRHDRESMKSQAWSHPDEYRQLRVRTSARRSSDDAVVRDPDPGQASQARRLAALARTGQIDPAPGAGPSPAAIVPRAGAMVAHKERPDAPEGPLATETSVDGAVRENLDSARASDERDPGPFDMTPPTVAGEAAPGVAPDALGRGTAAFRASGADGDAARRGADGDPYLRRLVARVLDRVVYPPELALGLEQGEVIVEFMLRRDGTIGDIKIARASGFRRFDEVVVVALERAAPFGPVPEGLSRGRAAVRVKVPFAFDNPVIR